MSRDAWSRRIEEMQRAATLRKASPADKAKIAAEWNGGSVNTHDLADGGVVDSTSGGVESRHAPCVLRPVECRPAPSWTGGSAADGQHEPSKPCKCRQAGVAPGPLTKNAGAAIRKDAESRGPRPASPAPLRPNTDDARRTTATPSRRAKPIVGAPILEKDVLKAVREALELHPRVAWVARINSGRFEIDGRWITASFKGCSDLVGQLVTGEFMACEAKAPAGMPTPEQSAFLETVNTNGGFGFIARSIDDVYRALGEPRKAA